MLQEKYQELIALANQMNISGAAIKEEGGKLKITGKVTYQGDKDHLWGKIKTYPGWENEVMADLTVADTTIYGVYTVQPGDTLSKISKVQLHDPNRYMDIFNINTDQLKDPNMIRVGQKLKIPSR